MSDTTTTAAADFSTVRDFPDRVSPMVVKELRQGLRGRNFVGTAVGFHALLIIILATSVQEQNDHGMVRAAWWIFSGVMVFLLPLRGLSALAEERSASTLDTLVLTNLSAGRILRGKWMSIAAQITLLAVSVLPYLMVMYLAHGAPLPLSLITLGRLWLTGLLMAAVMVGISWNTSWLVRTGLALAAFLFAIQGPLRQIFGVLRDGHFFVAEGIFWPLLAETFLAVGVGFILLEMAAAMIAPHENHSGPARLAALLLFLVTAFGAMAGGSGSDLERLGRYALRTLAVVSLFSLTEPIPDQSRPAPGLLRWLPFRPGWRQGLWFCLFVWGLALLLASDLFYRSVAFLAHPLAAWLFCGWLLTRFLPKRLREQPQALLGAGLLFIILQVGLQMIGTMLEMGGVFEKAAKWIPNPLPVTSLDTDEASRLLAWAGWGLSLVFALADFLLPLLKKPSPAPSGAEDHPDSP